jgi:hypothetical protein
MYLTFLGHEHMDIRVWAYQGLGQLLVRFPALLPRASKHLELALSASANPKIKIQVLKLLMELLNEKSTDGSENEGNIEENG